MRILKLWGAALVLAVAVSGCGMSSYLTSNQNQNSTTVILSDNNYSVVGNVEASVSSTYIFGIGGLGKKALYGNAMSKLSEYANLTGSQALINISTKTHVQSLLIWSRYTVVTRGTVIEFHDKPEKKVENKPVQVDLAITSIPEKVAEQTESPAQQPVKAKIKGQARYKDYLDRAADIDSAIRYRKIKEAKILMNELESWYNSYEEPNSIIEENLESLQRTLNNLDK